MSSELQKMRIFNFVKQAINYRDINTNYGNLMKIRWFYFKTFKKKIFGNTLTSSNIPYEVMSAFKFSTDQ
jgi:hypothetical protein